MKKTFLFLLIVSILTSFTSPAFAYRKGSRPSQDTSTYGHDANGRLTRNDNMWNDTDSDGSPNYYDSNDSNSSVW
jgi:hypothetical protein